MLKIKRRTVLLLVNKGILVGVIRKMGTRSLCLISKSSADALKDKYERALTMDESAKKLKIKRHHVMDLVHDKLLEPLRGPTIEGGKIWLFEEAALIKLLDNARESSVLCENDPSYTIGFQSAVLRLRTNTTTLIKAMLNQEIKSHWEQDKEGFCAFLFSDDDLRQYRIRKREKQLHTDFP